MGEYKDYSIEKILEIEKEKLVYFIITYSQKIILSDSLEKDIEKEFYGYEFSNRKGHEGIHIYKDEDGILQSKLYNPENLYDEEKANYYILNNFKGLISEKTINEIKQSEDHPLKNHIDYINLSDLMSFDLKTFDKQINLNFKKKLKIDSKYPLHKIKDLINIEYGTRIVKNKEAGTLYPVYGGGAETFKADKFNRENCFVISRFGMSPHCVRYVKDKFFLNDSGFTYSIIHDDCNKKYLDNLLATYESIVYLCGRGVGQKNIDIDLFNNIKLPLPPMNIQEEIVKEIEVQNNIELKNID